MFAAFRLKIIGRLDVSDQPFNGTNSYAVLFKVIITKSKIGFLRTNLF